MSYLYNHRFYSPPAIWQVSSDGRVPYDSPVVGGHDVNGEMIYVGRAVHDGDTVPGKVVPSHRTCYVSHGGREHAHHNYQVLANPKHSELIWVHARNGEVPTGALQGGQQSNGTKLYIGRANHHGSLVVGKVHPEHRVLYFPFGGDERSASNYEVLVIKHSCPSHS